MAAVKSKVLALLEEHRGSALSGGKIAEKLQHLPPEQVTLLENVIDTFLLAIAQAAQASDKE